MQIEKLTKERIEKAGDAWRDVALSNLPRQTSSDEIIEAIAPHVQYEATEPGAPLTERENATVFIVGF